MDIEKLIRLYEERNVLWDSNIPEYHDRNKRRKALKEICDELNVPG